MAGLLPMVPLVERSLGVDQHIGDVLDVTYLPFAAADFQQRIVRRRLGVGRIKQQHAAVLRAVTGGELPVLALDVVDDRRAWPGQERRHDQADAFAGTGRREAQHMLRAVVTEIVLAEPAEHDAICANKPGCLHLTRLGPARRTVGLDVLRLPGPPDRHADRRRDRDEAAGRSYVGALDEDLWRISVVDVPPPEEDRRIVEWHPGEFEPGPAELRLEAEPPRRPLRGAPGREQHEQEDDADLAP